MIETLKSTLSPQIFFDYEGEAIAMGFQHYILSLETPVMIPTMLVPLMGGLDLYTGLDAQFLLIGVDNDSFELPSFIKVKGEGTVSLVKHGFKVTFVNAEFNHKRIVATLNNNSKDEEELEKLITMINGSDDDDDITWVISDMSCTMEVAEKMDIERAAFWTVSVGTLLFTFHIKKLIGMGIIDENGQLLKNETIQLSPMIPTINPAHFVWLCIGDSATQKFIFQIIVDDNKTLKSVNWHICNSSYGLEPAAFELLPQILPIGPLLKNSRLEQPAGHFWQEDITCLNWLDQQPIDLLFILPLEASWSSIEPNSRNWLWDSNILFMNLSYICDVWRVGLRLIPDESGIVRSEEVKEKVKELLCHEEIKIRISELMEIATKGSIDGDSSKNLENFVKSRSIAAGWSTVAGRSTVAGQSNVAGRITVTVQVDVAVRVNVAVTIQSTVVVVVQSTVAGRSTVAVQSTVVVQVNVDVTIQSTVAVVVRSYCSRSEYWK
ncbi:hypothetical protein GIB67_000714 [Kingdonia uniflora]|uniref:Uncharacterized protein n=1 Tax=Kingdonia uniflora TaxID=39325 RepID=A0A7J7NDQ1_9MAGN|nr:hypothetical protein GIB67_000714 [Kingdonia uniflora]